MGVRYANPDAVSWIILKRDGREVFHTSYCHSSLQGQILAWEQKFRLQDGDRIVYGTVSTYGSSFTLVRMLGGYWVPSHMNPNSAEELLKAYSKFSPIKREWLLEIGRNRRLEVYNLQAGCSVTLDVERYGSYAERIAALEICRSLKWAEGEHNIDEAQVRQLLACAITGSSCIETAVPADSHWWVDFRFAQRVLDGTHKKAELPEEKNAEVPPYYRKEVEMEVKYWCYWRRSILSPEHLHKYEKPQAPEGFPETPDLTKLAMLIYADCAMGGRIYYGESETPEMYRETMDQIAKRFDPKARRMLDKILDRGKVKGLEWHDLEAAREGFEALGFTNLILNPEFSTLPRKVKAALGYPYA